ncbi:hypothetical protein BWQ96_01620 [Gracilariopsis chorda]|uniref:Uncharacterized protein n=1 Tax=Gracilariopsis chorda TaxID=448386 RepID=A0A2V3J1Y0_9FLOR|nr:hypothetical protein BWQ96_01620 [Gracilariopsis chorda]|eukprot:PXF48451.1 hypothetical protein BWQ96_01620 [Gracilariopsis chorda]
MEVIRCRALLITDENDNEFTERKIDESTFEKRVEIVLKGEGIILRKLSYQLRFYICVEQVDKLLQGMAASASSSIYSSSRPSLIETWTHLEAVAARFEAKKSVYWGGRWSLSEEVASVSAQLWLDVIFQMASRKRAVSWTRATKMHGVRLESIFPASHSTAVLTIEEHLRSRKDFSRGDLLLCVRALKVIEQMVMSRTNSVSGPLTISLSVSGICERLIAERERDRPWDFNVVNDVAIPVLHFENWDIKPLHAVKVDGKALPKVNGSLLQGQLRGSKRSLSEKGTVPSKRQKLLGVAWKDIACLGSREDFIDELTNTESSNVLRQFNNVVFGMVSWFRGQLVGGKEAANSEYNSGTTEEFIFGTDRAPLNFRIMLLSCFKPHGGRPLGEESL